MKLTLAALVAAFALVCPIAVSAPLQGLESVRQSITQLNMVDDEDGSTGHCTAFSVADITATYITAHHCLAKQMEAEGKGAVLVLDDPADDLAAVRIPGLEKPRLQLGREPKEADPVTAVGYGYDWGFPFGLPARVVLVGVEVMGQNRMILDRPIAGGMSGGPVVDNRGEVVSVNQISNNLLSGGVGYGKFRAFWKRLGL